MSKKKFLEILIESMTQSELKRFALYTKTYASNKSYLELFKSIKNGTLVKNKKYDNKYAQQRRYLYRTILESFILKDTEKSPENEVLFLLKSAGYLLRKQLPEQAYAIINKALQLVKKYEMTGYHIELIELEKEVRMYANPKKHRSDEEIIKEEQNLIEYQKELQTLKLIYNHIINYKKRYGYIDNRLWQQLFDEIRVMGLPDSAEKCHTQRAKYYYFYDLTLLNWIQHRHAAAYEYSKKMIQIDTAPISKMEYLNGLLEHSSSCLCLGKTDELLAILHRVKQYYDKGLFGQYDNVALKIFYYSSNYELMSYVFKGDKEKVISKISEIEKGMKKWGDKIPMEMKLILASVLKLGYLALKDTKKTAAQISFLLDHYKSGLRLDAYDDGLIYSMIFAFEKDDPEYLERQAGISYKHFNNYQNTTDIDVAFKIDTAALFLQYAAYKIDKKELLVRFKKLLMQKLEKFDNQFSEIDYPYLLWVESQLRGMELLETARILYKERLATD
jgi:hypothetical protein